MPREIPQMRDKIPKEMTTFIDDHLHLLNSISILV